MSRLINKSVPKYRKHKASGQAIVTLGGRDFYLGPYGTRVSRSEYDRVVAEWLAHGRVLVHKSIDDPVTVVEVCAQYLTFARNYYGQSPSEVEKIKLAVRPLLSLYGRTSAQEFGPRKLETVRKSMVDDGLSLRTINQRIERIKRLFRWAVRNESVSPDIWHGLQAVEGLRRGQAGIRPPGIVTAVSDGTVEQTIPFMLPPVRAMVRLQLLTGMRSGEVVRMRGLELDMTGPMWFYRPTKHKTAHRGYSREIALGPQAQTVIRSFLRPELDQYLFQPSDAMAYRYSEIRKLRKNRVQPSQVCRKKRKPKRLPGNCYTVASYRRAVARACDTAFPLQVDLRRQANESVQDWKGRLTPECSVSRQMRLSGVLV